MCLRGVQLWCGGFRHQDCLHVGFGDKFWIPGLALTLVSVKRFGSGLNCFLIQLTH